MVDEEKLVEQVKRFQHLYDISHPKYMDSAKKNIAWKEIAKELRQPVAACKQKWQSLRDAYRRALNKRKTNTGTSKASLKKWKYETEMAFLIPFFVERKSSRSMDVSSDEEVSDDIKDGNLMSKQSLGELVNSDTFTSGAANMAAYCIDGSSINVDRAATNKLQLHCKNEFRESSASVLMAHMLEERAKERTPDEMDSFFLNISSTVKKFSPYLQAVAKNKIFTLVSEMEIQQLTQTTFVSTPTTSTATKPDSPSNMPPSPSYMPSSPIYMPTSPQYVSSSPNKILKVEVNADDD